MRHVDLRIHFDRDLGEIQPQVAAVFAEHVQLMVAGALDHGNPWTYGAARAVNVEPHACDA
jgi:hypothetical protein